MLTPVVAGGVARVLKFLTHPDGEGLVECDSTSSRITALKGCLRR